MKSLRILGVLPVLFALTACSTKMVKTTGDLNPVRSWKSVAIAQVVVAPPAVPVLPLVDAAIYRASMSKISGEINQLHKESVDSIASSIGVAMRAKGVSTVLLGKELFESEAYRNAAIQERSTAVKDNAYPELVAQQGTKNLIDVGSKSFNDQFLNSNKLSSEELAKLAAALGVDGIVVGVASVPTLGVGMFGITGSRISRLSLYFYDAKGARILTGLAQSEASGSGPSDLKAYSMKLTAVSKLSDELAKKIYAGK